MDVKVFFVVFGSILLAELGDKSQIATMLFAADKDVSKLTVFIATSLAFIVAAAIGVLLGSALSQVINERWLNLIAGSGFIVIGVFTIYRATTA